ncbi:MAG: peptidoglycan-binding protein [Acidimicrobiia bacterium]|nr:peptidoglycan-binding protein [Acidimicrobiia bacterium]
MRRALTVTTTLLLLVAIGVGGWWAIDRFSEEDVADDPEEVLELESVAVVRTDLVDRETLDGTLRFGDPGLIVSPGGGTITGVPEAGQILRRGDVAFEIDGAPVIVMFGARPVWRPMLEGIPEGDDVRQLEANLVLLGFTLETLDEDDDDNDDDDDEDEREFTVDTEFDDVTTDLVAAWQTDLELEDTGIVDLGRIVFLPQAVRIADVAVEVGTIIAPGTPILTTSSVRQEVQLWLDADRQDLLDIDDTVGLELPNEAITTGTVVDISDVVTTIGVGPEARRVFEVTIRLSNREVAAGLDEAPVDIEVISRKATGVLAVPVDALLALAEGGYAVQVEQPGGAARFVAVDIGRFADGLVAVTGDLNEGDRVLVPR